MDASEHVRPKVAVRPWDELNRDWLIAAMAALRARLENADEKQDRRIDLVAATEARGFKPALVHLADVFGLSPFERELLLLLTGLELDSGLRAALARRAGDIRATFDAALALLVSPHWDALSADAPLRRWRMVSLDPAAALVASPLRLDERILHFVAGIAAADAALAAIVTHVDVPSPNAAARDDLADRATTALADRAVIALQGGMDATVRRDWIMSCNARKGRATLWIEAGDLPGDPDALAVLARHLDREAALTGATPALNVGDGPAANALGLAARMTSGLIWVGAPVPGLGALASGRRLLRFDMPAREPSELTKDLLARWRSRVHPDKTVEAELVRAAQQFRLGGGAIDDVIETVVAAEPKAHATAVWPAMRAAARGGLDDIAQRIETRARFADIVLPSAQTGMLRDIARQLRHRETVYRDWGFASKYQLGQGLVALFAGESGTGKTLAAEAIAGEARLDLYRVDLATLVSKYIGETEKNLKRLFDAADASGAVLLFDEADALFGKRSEVKDSHDRYANIEVAYLLQRVEAYRGLAILTTNMKSALDRAFLRRIRFVVNFPVPDAAARERIWRLQFPTAAPLGAIDFRALAKLNVCGGNIRSIAVGAAFKAADAGRAIDQPLLMAAAHEEFAKLERSMGGDRGRAS